MIRQVVLLALQVSIIGTVFGFGLNTTARDLLYLFRRPGLLARSLLAVFVIMPAVAVALVRIFDFPRVVGIVLDQQYFSRRSQEPTPPNSQAWRELNSNGRGISVCESHFRSGPRAAYFRRIFSMALPLASSSTSLSM